MLRAFFFLTLGLISTIAIGAGVLWVLDRGEDAARSGSTKFATALVQRDASLAPEGGADFLDAIHDVYGGVSAARVIDTRNHRVGSGDDARTYFVADLLLQTKRGPAVIELEFDSPSLSLASETVTDVRELAPQAIPGDALDDAELTAVAKAFSARGGEPAGGFGLDATIAKAPVATPAKPKVTPAQREARKRLRCVQEANGDVSKMARC